MGRAVSSLLMDNAGDEFTGEEIAEAVDLQSGPYGVAGVLGYPGRHAYKIGRPLPTVWHEDSQTGEGFYSMPKAHADLFKAARAKAEGAKA